MEKSFSLSNRDGLLPHLQYHMVQTIISCRLGGPTSRFENPINEFTAIAEKGGPESVFHFLPWRIKCRQWTTMEILWKMMSTFISEPFVRIEQLINVDITFYGNPIEINVDIY
jgi:hypothetical protein